MAAPTSKRRAPATKRILLALLLLAAARQGQAQAPASALSALPERTFSPEASERCQRAHKILTAPAGTYYPRERLAAMEQYRWCLSSLPKQPALEGVSPAGVDTRGDLQLLDAAVPSLQGGESFLGISFGVGVGVSIASEDIVPEAQVGPNNTVVVVKRERQLPRVILETHYYGWCASALCKAGRFGWGPYLAVVAKSDKLISAFSAGLMVGWRNPAGQDSQGFSLGIGPILDDAVNSLASGFKPGRPLPSGETAIRYEEKARWGFLIFGSRTF